jgi:hypothetical protein
MAGISISIAFAQQKKINDLTSFKLRNSGALMDKEMDVDGYYLFYEMDKLKKGQREFSIQMMDKNLNEIANKSYIDHKNVSLVDGKFNNQALLFAFSNPYSDNYKAIIFDREANEVQNIEISSSKEEKQFMAHLVALGQAEMIFTVDNKGFLFNYIVDNKKVGYGLKYIPTDGGNAWEYNSPSDLKEIKMINPIEANDKVVIALEMTKKSMLSGSVTMGILVLDVNNGKLLFERNYSKNDDPRFITNAFLKDDNTLVLLGEYFEPGDNIYKDKSSGLFAETTDLNGNRINDSKVSWEDKIGKLMAEFDSEDEDKMDKGYVYFHDIIRNQDGSFYAIGERYKKTKSAGGLAMTILSKGGENSTQLTITDAVMFKFDKNFSLIDAEVIEKGRSRIPIGVFSGPQLAAHRINAIGGFDYQFTQIDTRRERFYSSFIDYERIKGDKNKWSFTTVMHQDGKFAKDKIYLDPPNESTYRRILPGKLGHVVIMDYDKEEKSLDIHLEKLNFEIGLSK